MHGPDPERLPPIRLKTSKVIVPVFVFNKAENGNDSEVKETIRTEKLKNFIRSKRADDSECDL